MFGGLASWSTSRSAAPSDNDNDNDIGDSPGHSQHSSLDEDEASMSDLTSTSYQNQVQQSQPQTQTQQAPHSNNSSLPELTMAEGSGNSNSNRNNNSSPSPERVRIVGNMGSVLRRPARIASRLESIPSVGYVNSHEEPDSPLPQRSVCMSSGHDDDDRLRSPASLQQREERERHMDKFAHHLRRYNDHVDAKKQQQQPSQTDVTTDASTADESESEWSASLLGSRSSGTMATSSASASPPGRIRSRSSSSSTLRGLPHTMASFSTSATDGDVDTDLDDSNHLHHDHCEEVDSDSLNLYHRHPQHQPPYPLAPHSNTSHASSTSCAAPSWDYHHQQQQLHQPQRTHHRTPSRTGSISRPRYAVEFRHRPTPRRQEQQQLHHQQQHQYPSPAATEAALQAQAVAVYGRDGRHVERVVLDVADPYLGHDTGSLAAEDEDMDMDHNDRLELGAANHHRYPQYSQHHKLRRSDVGLAGLPLPTPTTPVETLHHKPPPPVSALFGSLFRTVQTIFLLGAVGATVTLLRVHFLLATAGGRAAAATSGGGGAAAIFGSVASSLASSSQGLVAGGGIAAVRLANGALALPPVTDLLLTAAVRQAARSERAVLREQVQRTARMLPDGRPVSPPGSGGRRLSTQDGGAPASAGGGETYAVRLSTTPGRSDLTDAAVERLARCPSIADVRLDRSSEGKASGDGGSDLLGGWGDEGSIIKRPALTTDAVLLLPDDLAITCEELDRGKSILCLFFFFSSFLLPLTISNLTNN